MQTMKVTLELLQLAGAGLLLVRSVQSAKVIRATETARCIRLTGLVGKRPMTSRGPYPRNLTPFKVQLCQDIRAWVIGRRDVQRSHNISSNLIQLWLTQFDRWELTDEEAETSVIAEYETRIAALSRKLGQLTIELNLAKKHCRWIRNLLAAHLLK